LTVLPPAKASHVRQPSRTALFGDGQYSGGANKFMRSPFVASGEPAVSRFAGTQGFRHRRRTNVAFCDGHAESVGDRHTTTTAGDAPQVAPATGFLSEDNSLYDLQ
jgi:prepilin-type processing-associated H-X9-DG protein